MSASVDVGIVIVNWNTRDLLRGCLRSLAASDASVSRRVVVVDNASSDGSAAMVRAEFPEVTVVENGHNLGFAAANNQGLRLLGFGQPCAAEAPRYALLLNPDTELPPEALRLMIARFDADPRIGAGGPRLVLPNGKLDLACRRSFPTPEVAMWRMLGLSRLFPKSRLFGRYNLTYLDEHLETEVDCVVGAFMLVRREVIERVGLLDETFWMYGEDIDWAYRIKQDGWKVLYYPKVTVLHIKRAASRHNPRTRLEFQRASLIFYYKHFARQTPRLMHWAILAGLLIRGGRPLWADIRALSKSR
ncbi:MAG: glycosyltransferase family 2 protein [Candidatus Thermofonsia Clade 1 bacterium]|jgi:GT2 family glycosyltransferase|uniref:Glycosyltransferase family 2 protein n=1 Tax=Candidatus Thermofonsia Clade 1 bacterium TaxID=2364210 RepID=A0A2M8PWX9_9CHLR|nr:MAG: glycosyltransferase family 2 protein [Candidatus Thermofonsia Clade 1 bacterium]PJF42019.1 MAG: glycosyltransferase family 2 protein [Candidatus Thermofonsia Clade 1 bacterium]RMF50745.1 MAG: glycosyltransferase family 2 protein [Chloroflexota bacterium]